MKRFQTLIARITPTDGQAPEWVLLFAAGEGEVEGEGTYLVDRAAFDLVKAAFDRRGIDLVFDYEHQTLKDMQAPAAGWLRELRWTEGVGIEARVDWTEAAAAMIVKHEYRYHSPVFLVRKSDRRLAGLHSVALTNAPKTNHLKPLLAKLGDTINEEEDHMHPLLKKILEALGLAETVTEDAAMAAVAKLQADAKKAPEVKEVVAKDVLEALELKEDDSVSTVVASIHAIKQGTKGMVPRAELVKLQARLDARDAAEAVDAAMTAGKITPDQKEWAEDYAAKDLDGFKAFAAKAPVVVPLAKLPGKKAEADTAVQDEATLQVAKMFGNSAEDLKTHGAA